MQFSTISVSHIQLQTIPDRRRRSERRSTNDRRDKIRFTFEEEFSDRRKSGGRRKDDKSVTGWYSA